MSELFNLNLRDFIKGLIVAVLTGVLTTVYQALSTGGEINFKAVGLSALTSLVAYLLKNLATDKNGKLLGKV